ncbi:hypothetical protein BM527_04540 [Alteromonas sp. Mex14]|nr:hypothetical protein BM527_04540 [Alteromonas sp. Mex14]
MTTDNNKNSQRNIRYTIRLNEQENELIRHDALNVKNYSNKAVARYIRDELLSSVSKADNGPSIIVPSVNEQIAKDLKGAVTNLNQSVKVLNQAAISSSYDDQINLAKKMMRDVIKLSKHCKSLHDFSKGITDNKALIKAIMLETFSFNELKEIALQKSKEAKQ